MEEVSGCESPQHMGLYKKGRSIRKVDNHCPRG